MRLATKISLALAIAAVLAACVIAAGFQVFLAPRYERLDREAGAKNAARLSATIELTVRK